MTTPPKKPSPTPRSPDPIGDLELTSVPAKALPRPVPRARVPPPKQATKPVYPDAEPPTAARNRKVTLLETVVATHAAILDHVGEPRMTDLIEINKLYADWDEGRCRLLLALARAINGDNPFP